MCNDYINEKIMEKLEYDCNLFKEYVIIYMNLIIKFPNDFKLRSELNGFVKKYYVYSKNEYKLLYKIKQIKNYNLQDCCIEILDKLESIFEKQFNYNEDILNGYEEAIFYEDRNRANFVKISYSNDEIEKKNDYLDEEIKKYN